LFVVQAAHTHLGTGSLKTGARLADISDVDSSVAYSNGHLLFVRGNTLMAQPFAPGPLRFTGDPAQFADRGRVASRFNFGVFSAAATGGLVYQGGAAGATKQVVWFDRSGKQLGGIPGTADFNDVTVSPSGEQLLIEIAEGTANARALWLYDLAT